MAVGDYSHLFLLFSNKQNFDMKQIKNYYLLAVGALMTFAGACSSSNDTPDIKTTELKLVSTTPANGATDVSADITEIVLSFNTDVTVMPRGYNLITVNGNNVRNDISVSGKDVKIAITGTPKTTYTIYVPSNTIAAQSDTGVGCTEINLTFTTASRSINITAEVEPNSNGMSSEAIAWTKKIYAGWNLGNSFESCAGDWDSVNQTWSNIWMADRNEWETAWGNPKTTEAMIVALKQAGFNAVRIPVRWQPHVTNEQTMEIDSKWIARVKEVVDYCVNNGMYAIVNTHHDLWMENRPLDKYADEISDKEIKLWKNIATYFRDYDEHLVFSGTNEVNINWAAPTEENYRVQNNFNQDFVKAVRSTGGRNWYRNLIVQTYSANPNYGLSGFVAPADVVDNRLIVEFHYYDPYDYCSGGSGVYYWGTQFASYGTISKNGGEAELKSLFDKLDSTWHAQGLGIIMGETGVSYHLSGTGNQHQLDNMKYYLTCVYSEAKSHGIAPFVWDNNVFGNGSEMFGIFDRNNGMKVRIQEFLDGIMAGAQTNYPQ